MSINFDGSTGDVNAVNKTGISKEQMMKKLSKKQQAQMEIVFNKFDKSKDGVLNETEMQEVYEYFSSLDKSGDGKITKKELQAGFEALTKKEKRVGADMYELFFNQLAGALEPPKEEKQTRAERRAERKEVKEAAKNAPSEAEIKREQMLKDLSKDFKLPEAKLKEPELQTIDLTSFKNADNVHTTSFGEILDNIIKARYNVTDQKDVALIRAKIKDLNDIAKNAADIPKSIKMPDTIAVGEKEYIYTKGKVQVSHEGFYYQKKEAVDNQDGQSVIKRFNDKKEEIGGTRFNGTEKAYDYTTSKDADGNVATSYKDAKGNALTATIDTDKKAGFVEVNNQKYYISVGEKGEHNAISETKYNELTAPPAQPTPPADSTQTPVTPPPTVPADSTQTPVTPPPTVGLPEGVTQEKRTDGNAVDYTADIKDGKEIKRTYFNSEGKVYQTMEYDEKGNNTKSIYYDKDGKVEYSYGCSTRFNENGDIISNSIADAIFKETDAALWSSTKKVNAQLANINKDNIVNVLRGYYAKSPDKGLIEACDDIINGPGQKEMVPVIKALLTRASDKPGAQELQALYDKYYNPDETGDFPRGVAHQIDEAIKVLLEKL